MNGGNDGTVGRSELPKDMAQRSSLARAWRGRPRVSMQRENPDDMSVVNALWAVLRLHRFEPAVHGIRGASCKSCGRAYPCPTVHTVVNELQNNSR